MVTRPLRRLLQVISHSGGRGTGLALTVEKDPAPVDAHAYTMIVCKTAPAPTRSDSHHVVTVQAPGRLHLGFLDPSGSLGRSFGSVGLVLDGFETVVSLTGARNDVVTADSASAQLETARAEKYLAVLRRHSGLAKALHLRLQKVLPAHAGLGSGTQLALAVGHAFARWHGLSLSSATLAQWLGRGLRSGIGIAGFDQGGLLVEGGPSADGLPAPLLARINLPEAWRVIVVQEDNPVRPGLSGGSEDQAIANLPLLPRAVAADICHQVLMRVLPGAACADFAPFAAGITHMQQLLGAHFAPAQGDAAYTSAAVGQLVRWLGDAARESRGDLSGLAGDVPEHGAAIGQSSWGPTGFAIVPSQARAEALVQAAKASGQIGSALSLHIVPARNRGASVSAAALA